jgi:negative regulator of genetic competence, sporulation and motility
MAASIQTNGSLLSHPLLAGLRQMLNPENEDDEPSATEISDDREGEQETIDIQTSEGLCEDGGDDSDDEDGNDSSNDEEDKDVKQMHAEFVELADVVKNASKGVTEGTDGEYRRFFSAVLFALGPFI